MNWKEDAFLEKYTDNYNDLFRKCNIFDSEVIVMENFTCRCEICYEEPFLSLKGCQHQYCENCLQNYMTIKIDDGIDSGIIKCPAYKCNNLIPDELIQQIVIQSVFEKYQQRILDDFIFMHLKLQNCPAPNCKVVINLLDSTAPSPVICLCGTEFCFHCDFEISHYPLPCKMLREFTALMAHFGKTPASSQWIQNNTKPCPKCRRPILKHEGCDHMNCSQCGHSYNWSSVTTHDSDKPFFVPSNVPNVELTLDTKRKKIEQDVDSERFKNYDLEKFDACTSKYVAALAMYRIEMPIGDETNYEVMNAVKALKKCNKLLVMLAVLEFFIEDEKMVFFVFSEYELHQRVMKLEKVLECRLRGIKIFKKKKASRAVVEDPMLLGQSLM